MYFTKILLGFGEAMFRHNTLNEACDEVKKC